MEGENLKKNKIIVFALSIIILVIIFILLYKNISNSNNTQSQEEKAFAEIEFLDGELVNLFNQMNNIEIRNYNVSVKQINEKDANSEENGNVTSGKSEKNVSSDNKFNTNSNSNQSSDNSSSNSGNGANSSNSSENSNNSLQNSQGSTNSTTQNEEFQLQSTSIFIRNEQIDWNKIKSKIETLYSSVPTITLDLYQIQVNQDDILNFNKELDKLTLLIGQEKKEECLLELATIYEYIPKFAERATNDELEKTILETKKNLLKGYSKLDSQNWSEIAKDASQTIENFTTLLTNVNENDSKQYTINKIYVMLNELQNAVNIQDTNVFLIKYKNILEELNDL